MKKVTIDYFYYLKLAAILKVVAHGKIVGQDVG